MEEKRTKSEGTPIAGPAAQQPATALQLSSTEDAATRQIVAEETIQPDKFSERRTNLQSQPGADDDSLEDRIRQRLSAADDAGTGVRVDPLVGTDICGRYRVLSKIGAGGMGAVYRARQIGMSRDVAIKVLLRELTENETVVRRFHIEALAVSKLRHPNTIQIFDFGETDDGLLYIAMELLEGTPLEAVLKNEQQLAADRGLYVAEQIAKSLREAHTKGIVHRDLKPDNIILEQVGEDANFVKVLDFGVAKLAEGDGQQKTLTKAGSIFGTPKYMSPEQCRGGDIDARSDIYSIGVLLYEMIMGRPPFSADNPLGILIKHLQEQPPPFQQIRPDLVISEPVEDFVFKMLSKNPDDRFQTAEALIRAIEALRKSLPELFGQVVTREAAEAAGIEITISSRTALNTELNVKDNTLMRTDTIIQAPADEGHRSRRWPMLVMALLLVLLGTGGGLYAAIEPLPEAYYGFTDLAQAEVGTVPEFDLKSIFVSIVSTPIGADVLDSEGVIISKTPFTLRRTEGAPPESYTFKFDGHEDYMRSFTFDEDATITFQLSAIVNERPLGGRDLGSTTDSNTAVDKPSDNTKPTNTKDVDGGATGVVKDPVVIKLPETKDNPYGGPRKLNETKKNPYGTSPKKPKGASGGATKSNPY